MSADGHDVLYLLEAFGLRNEWVTWRLKRSGLDAWCRECRGEGIVVTSPCRWREAGEEMLSVLALGRCTPARGCWECRRRCPRCRGTRLERADVVRREDFGDEESLDAALAMFPGLRVEYRKRSDREARAM